MNVNEVISYALTVLVIATVFPGIPIALLVLYIRRDDAKTDRMLRDVIESHERFMREQ